MNNISITPGKNNVGAYINYINLKDLNQYQVNEIKNTLNQFGVIFIKKQNLDPASDQVGFIKTQVIWLKIDLDTPCLWG